jgi:hypothetical protein
VQWRWRGLSRWRDRGQRRRRGNPIQDFRIGGLQRCNLVRHLVLRGGELLDALLKRGQTARYLLHLLGVNGGGGGLFGCRRV